MLHGHMTYQNLQNPSCKLRCKERGSEVDTLLLFMCVMRNQIYHIAIKDLTYLVLNKRKLDNKHDQHKRPH